MILIKNQQHISSVLMLIDLHKFMSKILLYIYIKLQNRINNRSSSLYISYIILVLRIIWLFNKCLFFLCKHSIHTFVMKKYVVKYSIFDKIFIELKVSTKLISNIPITDAHRKRTNGIRNIIEYAYFFIWLKIELDYNVRIMTSNKNYVLRGFSEF